MKNRGGFRKISDFLQEFDTIVSEKCECVTDLAPLFPRSSKVGNIIIPHPPPQPPIYTELY